MQKEARIACETGLRLIERWKSRRNKYSFLYNDVSNEFCISVQVYSLLVNSSAWFSMVSVTGSSLDLLSSNLALIQTLIQTSHCIPYLMCVKEIGIREIYFFTYIFNAYDCLVTDGFIS